MEQMQGNRMKRIEHGEHGENFSERKIFLESSFKKKPTKDFGLSPCSPWLKNIFLHAITPVSHCCDCWSELCN